MLGVLANWLFSRAQPEGPPTAAVVAIVRALVEIGADVDCCPFLVRDRSGLQG